MKNFVTGSNWPCSSDAKVLLNIGIVGTIVHLFPNAVEINLNTQCKSYGLSRQSRKKQHDKVQGFLLRYFL